MVRRALSRQNQLLSKKSLFLPHYAETLDQTAAE